MRRVGGQGWTTMFDGVVGRLWANRATQSLAALLCSGIMMAGLRYLRSDQAAYSTFGNYFQTPAGQVTGSIWIGRHQTSGSDRITSAGMLTGAWRSLASGTTMRFGKNGRWSRMVVGADGKLSAHLPETFPSPTSSLLGEIRTADRKYLSSPVTETSGRSGRQRRTAAGATGENWVRRLLK